MTRPASTNLAGPHDLPANLRPFLLALAGGASMNIRELRAIGEVCTDSRVDRLIAFGLVEVSHIAGQRFSVYSLTPRGRRFAAPQGGVALPRTKIGDERYKAPAFSGPYPTWRPGQEAFLCAPSVGLAT